MSENVDVVDATAAQQQPDALWVVLKMDDDDLRLYGPLNTKRAKGLINANNEEYSSDPKYGAFLFYDQGVMSKPSKALKELNPQAICVLGSSKKRRSAVTASASPATTTTVSSTPNDANGGGAAGKVKKTTKKETNKDRAPHPPSAYNLFMKDNLQIVKKANPALTHQEAFNQVTQLWNKMKEQNKTAGVTAVAAAAAEVA